MPPDETRAFGEIFAGTDGGCLLLSSELAVILAVEDGQLTVMALDHASASICSIVDLPDLHDYIRTRHRTPAEMLNL